MPVISNNKMWEYREIKYPPTGSVAPPLSDLSACALSTAMDCLSERLYWVTGCIRERMMGIGVTEGDQLIGL